MAQREEKEERIEAEEEKQEEEQQKQEEEQQKQEEEQQNQMEEEQVEEEQKQGAEQQSQMEEEQEEEQNQTEEEQKQEGEEQKQAEENDLKIDNELLLSFEEPDEELEKLPLAFTPKRPRTSSHSSPYNRTYFYNSRPQIATPREFTLHSRPMRVFTVQIPQGEPAKKRLRLALWLD